ncbi:MAG: mechanosensitive ion channel family protein, partial [Solobacterium sp.]|nr:mechanosensitive ion channel family protein [Solobacterium sp.]
LRYILGGSWTKGWNVFALSACALVLMSTVILVAVCRIPVNIISSMFGARSETLGHLLLSILKYGGTIGALFYCLYLVGLDAGGLLASVGILSLVIGLGAQSLIQDIIAGIFIVFEGEFRVGDIVTIKEFRGTVLDIGLRTTKIMGMDGNIKIFNNSEISGVLNMTKETSVAMTTISIEYGQDIEYVEAVLARDLPALKKNNPKLLDGPTYLGVSELGASGVSLRIIAHCREEDVRGMNRYLNREVLQIFYRNGINVPFNNVTLSNLDPSPKKTMADFLAEQEEKKE